MNSMENMFCVLRVMTEAFYSMRRDIKYTNS